MMNKIDYFQRAESWAVDSQETSDRSRRIAWTVAGVAAAIAMLEAVALALLTPLKTVQPITLLVDRQTGYVQALDPVRPRRVAADQALTQSSSRNMLPRAKASIARPFRPTIGALPCGPPVCAVELSGGNAGDQSRQSVAALSIGNSRQCAGEKRIAIERWHRARPLRYAAPRSQRWASIQASRGLP
jgi:hypothetical protein